MPDYSGRQFGNYYLGEKIGGGGFADVYLSEDPRTKTQVAVKVLHTRLSDKDLHKLVEEVRILHLKHPHIIEILDFGVENVNGFYRPFIVMTYAPHGNLRQRHPKGTRVPLSTMSSRSRSPCITCIQLQAGNRFTVT